jgi:hypothetical protein
MISKIFTNNTSTLHETFALYLELVKMPITPNVFTNNTYTETPSQNVKVYVVAYLREF